jgi:nucleoside-diphosphate-sugar epimerase
MDSFFKNKKIVVTGGSGFIGTHFLNHLIETGANVTTHVHKRTLQIDNDKLNVLYDVDLMKLDDCIKLTEGADYVIHCAGEVAHPSSVPKDVQISLKQLNLIGNVLEACAINGVKRFLDLNS